MNDDIDRTLRALHTTMGENIEALLDLDAGLREVLIAAHHRNLGRTLDHILDIHAGLQAIVPTAEQFTAAPATGTPTSEAAEIDGAVATWLLSLDTPTRLAIRNHPALDALAILFTLAHARFTFLARARVLDLARALDLARDLARVLDLDLARALDLARDLARVLDLDLARAHARVLTLDLARDLARACDFDLTPDFVRARDFDLTLDLVRARVRGLAVARVRGLAVARVRGLAVDLVRGLTVDLDLAWGLDRVRARGLARRLDLARHDFTTADLRGADLTQVQLDGLRWSTITQWPSETWRNQALLDSTEIEPGVYEIRGGTTNVPTHI